MGAADVAFQQYNSSLETIAKVGEVIALIFVLTIAIAIVGLVLFILWRQSTRADNRLSKEQDHADKLAQALNNLSDGMKSQQAVSKEQVTTLTTINDSLKTLTNLTTSGNTKLSDVSTQVTNVSDKLDRLIEQGAETLAILRNSPTEHAALRLSIEGLIELVKKEKKQTSETQVIALPSISVPPLTPIPPVTVSIASTTSELKAVGEPIPT